MNKTIILIILLTLPSAVCFAQADLEASFSGNYTYHSLFDPGYGFTVSGAMITERQHKLNIGLTYLRATLSEDEFWEIGAAAPDGYDYDYPTSSGDMSAFSFEVAPMFKFNQADDVRNYIGLGLNLVPIKVKEKGSYTLYTYDNNYNIIDSETVYYSFEASGTAPGFRVFFESQWLYNQNVAATFGFGFRYASINKLKIEKVSDQREYNEPGSYKVLGFHMYLGITYQLKKLSN